MSLEVLSTECGNGGFVCNGWNHPAGCECGFGPPYQDSVQYGEQTQWAEEALKEERLFKRGLAELNYDDHTIISMARNYAEINLMRMVWREYIVMIRGSLGCYV